MSNGWNESASAWINGLGERGDYGREFVLDVPMLACVDRRAFRKALDVGCGEGRFCRMLKERGILATGIDPTRALLDRARSLDPDGEYQEGRAEKLHFKDAEFDLVVSYLSLIDIPDADAAIAEMARVLAPGGSLLIANLNSFITAASPDGWHVCGDGQTRYCFDNYLEERSEWVSWRGIRIENWHRPLSTYFKLLLAHGLRLEWFDEPKPKGGDSARAARYRRAPYFHIMEWRKMPWPPTAERGQDRQPVKRQAGPIRATIA